MPPGLIGMGASRGIAAATGGHSVCVDYHSTRPAAERLVSAIDRVGGR